MTPRSRIALFAAAAGLGAGSALLAPLLQPGNAAAGPPAGSVWLWALLLGMGSGTLLTAIAGWLCGRSSRALAGLADRLALGDLDARAADLGDGGGGALGQEMDRMAAALSSRIASLSADRDRLWAIVSGMQEGVLLLDRGGRIVLVNPAFERMLGVQQSVAGQLPAVALGRPDLDELLARAWGVGSAASAEIDGPDDRRLLVHAAPLAGDPGGLLVDFMDVTEIRRLESLRRDFVANVSHELRTPIATIRSAAETFRGAAKADPDMAEHLVEVLERNSDRLGRLVDDLLDLSRIESRQQRLVSEPIDLAVAVRHVLDLFQAIAAEKGIAIHEDLPSLLPPVLGDAGGVEQILVNLVDNAVKYGATGGRIAIRAHLEGRFVAVAVSDGGPGIEARHLPRLFERFYRVDAGRSRELGGTGLGLAIVKHLVEAMGGTVAVDSAVGKGTTFRFTLPRQP